MRDRPASLAISRVSLAAACTLAGWTLAGCTLIDRDTFRRPGAAPAAADLARATLPDVPLLDIRFDQPDIDIQPSVNEAVEAVAARKQDAEYDVVFPIPTNATADVQETFAKLGQTDTALVVNALGSAGVTLDHVHVAYRGDPGAPPVEVRVYVR